MAKTQKMDSAQTKELLKRGTRDEIESQAVTGSQLGPSGSGHRNLVVVIQLLSYI